MPETRIAELLVEHARLMNVHGPDSAEAAAFLREHSDNAELIELADVSRRLKKSLTIGLRGRISVAYFRALTIWTILNVPLMMGLLIAYFLHRSSYPLQVGIGCLVALAIGWLISFPVAWSVPVTDRLLILKEMEDNP